MIKGLTLLGKFEQRLREDSAFRNYIYDSHAEESLLFIEKIKSFERLGAAGRLNNREVSNFRRKLMRL